jgi:hypothetical protein
MVFFFFFFLQEEVMGAPLVLGGVGVRGPKKIKQRKKERKK